MQSQLTVRLPSDLRRALRRAAGRLQRKHSDIVRLALRAFLQAEDQRDARPADRVRRLIGSLESGVPDLATRSRHYVIERLSRGT